MRSKVIFKFNISKYFCDVINITIQLGNICTSSLLYVDFSKSLFSKSNIFDVTV